MSIGESKANLVAAGRSAKDGAALDIRAAADIEAGAGMFGAAKEQVAAALAGLLTIIRDTESGVTGIQASHKGVRGEVGSVASRVDGSVQDSLRGASQTLRQESDDTKKQLGQARTALDVVAAAVQGLTTVQKGLDTSTALAMQAAETAKQGGAKQAEAGENVIKIAGTF